jgi:predicted metalloprotease
MKRAARFLLIFAVILVLFPQAAISSASAQSTPQAEGYASEAQGYAKQFDELITELDAFWLGIFQASGVLYRTPAVIQLTDMIDTGCGVHGPDDFAFYCRPDQSIYYSPQAFAEDAARIGDYVPVVVTAHEWGHHVQNLLGMVPKPGNAFELQADCLAGAYSSDASQRGLLDPGDVTEAVNMSAESADRLGLPQDQPGAHGINDDRVTAFMRGYIDGVTGCDLSLVPGPPTKMPRPVSAPAPSTVSVSQPDLASLIPSRLELPQGQSFRVDEEGATTLEKLAASFPDPPEAASLLQTWGWQGNRYRYYASDNPPPNAAGWVELSIHRFANADAAAAALPYFAAGGADSRGRGTGELGI